MGYVYEGIHETIERRVAIKLLKSEFAKSPEALTRFFNEARIVNRIEHESLVEVSDHGQMPDGTVFLVMEYVRGEMLRTRLNRLQPTGQRIAMEQTVTIMWQVAEALAAAHDKGVVHRDLKPDNIMLVPASALQGGERVKILDFGIAKLLQASQVVTLQSRMMGTPLYMSPEQCRSATDLDGRSDVYALGVMLYELLAGRPPFYADKLEALLAQHLFFEPDPLNQVAPQTPPALADLVHRLLRKNPAERPIMRQVVAELAQHLPAPSRLAEAPAAMVPMKVLPQPVLLSTSGHSTGQSIGIHKPRRWRSAAAVAGVTATIAGLVSLLLLGRHPAQIAAAKPMNPVAPAPKRADPSPSPSAAVMLFTPPSNGPAVEPSAHKGTSGEPPRAPSPAPALSAGKEATPMRSLPAPKTRPPRALLSKEKQPHGGRAVSAAEAPSPKPADEGAVSVPKIRPPEPVPAKRRATYLDVD